MTPEANPKRPTIEEGEHSTEVRIPEDGEGGFSLGLYSAFTDLYIRLIPPEDQFNALPSSLRFSGGAGGGDFPMIPEELSLIYDAIKDNTDKLERSPFMSSLDYIGAEKEVIAKKGESPEEPLYIIKNLGEDQNLKPENFMDIEISFSGDAKITQRDIRTGEQATVIFKTKENGGANPYVAEAFKRVAKRIYDAIKKSEEVEEKYTKTKKRVHKKVK